MRLLSELIAESRLSQADVAREVVRAGHKADAGHISRIVRGESLPSIELGLAIAKALDVDPHTIIWRAQEESAEK